MKKACEALNRTAKAIGSTLSDCFQFLECAPRRQHETMDRECRRNTAGELSRRRECAGGLQRDTSRTVAHRLLPWPKSVLSWTIGSCRCQSARAIRRRVVSGNYRIRTFETQTTSATIKAQTIPLRNWKGGLCPLRHGCGRQCAYLVAVVGSVGRPPGGGKTST